MVEQEKTPESQDPQTQPVILPDHLVEGSQTLARAFQEEGLSVSLKPLTKEEDKLGLAAKLSNQGRSFFKIEGSPEAVKTFGRVLDGAREQVSRHPKITKAAAVLLFAGIAYKLFLEARKGRLPSRFSGHDFE